MRRCIASVINPTCKLSKICVVYLTIEESKTKKHLTPTGLWVGVVFDPRFVMQYLMSFLVVVVISPRKRELIALL